jgi:hypothetical protein
MMTLAALCLGSCAGVARDSGSGGSEYVCTIESRTGKPLKTVDFEDGVIPFSHAGSAFKAEVPARLVTDPDGNKFFRITATPAEGGAGGFKDRVRSQASVGGFPAREGEIWTYSFSVRVGDDGPSGPSVLWQLFQYGDGVASQGYGAKNDGTGPTVWLIKNKDGALVIGNYYNGENDYQDLNLSQLPTNRFVDISVRVTWSLNPSRGRVDVYIDGQPAGSLSGAPTLLSSISKQSVNMHIGTYGGNRYVSVGVVDFDNIKIEQNAVENCALRKAPGA